MSFPFTAEDGLFPDLDMCSHELLTYTYNSIVFNVRTISEACSIILWLLFPLPFNPNSELNISPTVVYFAIWI